eukprot:TRINITY_DN588143_c0_g1_i2.p1 TRINITY_DN588143_c0_g1~~TRINITY_DN588143_c0_g1_i2.p1  ORF type:complete len:351 (-),score=49.30 TRINITY_DN588143_c0_g1_i2:893-1945(-)
MVFRKVVAILAILAFVQSSIGSSQNPSVLVLSLFHNSARFVTNYFKYLEALDYDKSKISLAFLESDSNDRTFSMLKSKLPELKEKYHSVELFQHNLESMKGVKDRHSAKIQYDRRKLIAKARNTLLQYAIKDNSPEYVLWLDHDLTRYGPEVLKELVKWEKDIIVPNVVMRERGKIRTYDLNSWNDHKYDYGKSIKSMLEKCRVTNVDRMQQRFEKINIFTAMDMLKMDQKDWFLLSFNEKVEKCLKMECGLKSSYSCNKYGDDKKLVEFEGYKIKHTHQYLDRYFGTEIVTLDGVGGGMLLVRTALFNEGLRFPTYSYDCRIETEGLARMAQHMGYTCFGLPDVQVWHN